MTHAAQFILNLAADPLTRDRVFTDGPHEPGGQHPDRSTADPGPVPEALVQAWRLGYAAGRRDAMKNRDR